MPKKVHNLVTIVDNRRNTSKILKKKRMKSCLTILALSSIVSVSAAVFSDSKISKEQYIDLWRQVAVRQMIDHKIPASITLAQGILESGSGNSDLAKKGNNHFGIKCHEWTGEKMYKDDDTANECFRVYANAEESYMDHSKFLTGKTRYSKLFTLEATDYKSWAKGLKEAGYATNPKYPDLLIELIEGLKLNELDVLGNPNPSKPVELIADVKTGTSANTTRTVLMHANNVKYIVAKKGDTFYKISKELSINLWQLYRYNDYGVKKDVLVEGDIVYLQPKRKHAKEDNSEYTTTTPMTLRQISQLQAIKIESLMKYNNSISPDENIEKGEKVLLR